jgi:hypothetical protein
LRYQAFKGYGIWLLRNIFSRYMASVVAE